MTECDKLPTRAREICEGVAVLPDGRLMPEEMRSKYLKAFGIEVWDTSQPSRGLGDTVAKITTKLGIKPCGGCKKRQRILNRWIPYKRKQPKTRKGRRGPFSYSRQGIPEFITMGQLSRDAKALASKLPADTSAVIGIARSGLTVASMVSMLLHRPLLVVRQSVGDVIQGGNGWRLSGNTTANGPVVVIDDTCMTGNSLKHVMPLVKKKYPNAISAVVYVNPNSRSKPNIFVRELPWPHLLEWNMFNSIISPHMAVDFDGVLCHDCSPQEDDDGPRYAQFLANVQPLYLARRCPIPMVVTARLEKYRPQTLAWLKQYGVVVNELVMCSAKNNTERARIDIAAFKAAHFKRFMGKRHALKPPVFVESCPHQAARIAKLSGGVVVCPAAGRCF